MDKLLVDLLREIESFGKSNDAASDEYAERMMNITPDTGDFLSVLVRATSARRILEIGTSNGYSTLWLAEAARANGGMVTTVEHSEFKIDLAKENFARSGLGKFISLLHEDAGEVLRQTRENAYDFIFLDTVRTKYPGWWPNLRRVLRPGGLIVADNALTHPEQLAPFIELVKANPSYTTSIVPVGNGEFMAVKSG